MPKLLVLFSSRTSATAALADAIAEGARTVRFTEVDVRRVSDGDGAPPAADAPAHDADRLRRYPELDDLERLTDYDALAIGSSVTDGSIAAGIQHLLDRAGELAARGELADRVGCAFLSGRSAADDQARALWSLRAPLAAMGMILVPPGRSAGQPSHTPLAVSALGDPDDDERARAREQGARLARVAEWVRHAKGHDAAAGGGHHHHHHH